ncbi:alpha-1,3-rhamnosyl/mannosyltransferase [Desulfobaculum xiamenense]|uniref:Alpha-1,3-rhamnosyl/mannosyltransferase n=1 Tax=Desulfobaculum xiamenense TaxID=995050 RepID=A0A846QUD1_9BACT|nr:glycosyltransferase family 1 protein [Desulfobaculum xiamenense]NJB68754.1 alpha-1,3-rhamnosyl/mannosyltransferase [Desulfobaculum xiamenense]
MRIIVNAIPLMNVNTGIGRYIRQLYAEIETRSGVEVGYFNGRRVLERMPSPPDDVARKSLVADLFWKLPARVALMVRLAVHMRRQLAFRTAAQGFDVYHETAFFPFDAPAGVRTVFTVHDLSLDRHPEWHPRERVLYFRRHFERSCRHVDEYLSVSRFTRSELAEVHGVAPERVTVTHLAHDPSLFRQRTQDEVAAMRERLGLPEAYFLFVGTGDPRKNVRTAARAAGVMGLDVPLVCAGWSGWGASTPGVVPLGYVDDDDLALLYAGARALVYPSLYEGFGLPVLEAMACGCPVLVSPCASLPEVAGDAALVMADPLDAEGLAAMMRQVATDARLREELSGKGLARAAKFSWKATADATLGALARAARHTGA